MYISAKTHENIDKLIDLLLAEVNAGNISQNDAIVTNFRHYEALRHALDSLHAIDEGFQNGLTNDLISLELRQVLHYLGLITGEISEDEIKKLEDELQKATDKLIKDVDVAVEEKSQDIMKV